MSLKKMFQSGFTLGKFLWISREWLEMETQGVASFPNSPPRKPLNIGRPKRQSGVLTEHLCEMLLKRTNQGFPKNISYEKGTSQRKLAWQLKDPNLVKGKTTNRKKQSILLKRGNERSRKNILLFARKTCLLKRTGKSRFSSTCKKWGHVTFRNDFFDNFGDEFVCASATLTT